MYPVCRDCSEMAEYVEQIERLSDCFRRLEGVGKKSALRMALSVLEMSDGDVDAFIEALSAVKNELGFCPICKNISSAEQLCFVCADQNRDTSQICVVEDSRAVAAIERARGYKGVYHVLHGTISPMRGVGPDDLTIKDLLVRLNEEDVSEVIIATNPTVEGETTAMYISKLISPLGIAVSRIANGVPVGGDLEFADEITMRRAIEGRYPMSSAQNR